MSFCCPLHQRSEYSRPYEQILSEALLAKKGAREIILLGQNVNAYKVQGFRLSNLIFEIEKISGIDRIRYTTSHPKDMTDDLIEIYKTSKKLMPLVHLPVQSGSDKILDLMNRKHSIKDYLEIFNKFKKINSKVQFSSDFIVGYPGESETDFEDTLQLVNEVKFINSYSFIFSPRPGTVAENLPIIDKEKSLKRLNKLQKILFDIQIKKNESLENTIQNVLVENRTEDKSKLFGRSEFMIPVLFKGDDDLIGKIVKLKIIKSNKNTLFGESLDLNKRRVA